MNIKFILLIIITQKSLIHCEISSQFNFYNSSNDISQVKVIRAIDNAILMAMTQDISLITDSSNHRNFKELLHGILSKDVSYTLRNINLRDFSMTKDLSSLMVLALENYESFQKLFLPKFIDGRTKFKTVENFLLIFLNDTVLDASKVFDEFWKLYVYNVVVLKSNQDSMDMLTFYPFSSNGCNNIKSISINKFLYENLTWSHDRKVFPQKLKNFYQCPIKASTFEYPPNVMIERFPNQSSVVKGYEIELLNGLSRILNFDLKLDVMTEANAWGLIFENGTATGLMRRTMKGGADIGFGCLYLTLIRSKYMSFTIYGSVDIILVIPRGELMTPLEKLFSPFDAILWSALAFMFVMGLVIISLLKLNPRKFHKYVFGKSSSSHLNMIEILLNGAQNFLPSMDSARFLLIAFVLFSLVVRTLYQAGMFKFLQTDQRHAALQTIDELIEKDFKIYMYESFQELSKGLKIHQNRATVGNKSIEYYQLKTLDPGIKLAAIGPLSEVIYFNQMNYKKFTFNVLPQIIFSYPIALFFPKNHYLVHIVENAIGRLQSAGLLDHWMKKYYDASFLKYEAQDSDPKKLTFNHLSGIFIIWIFGCCASCLYLTFEIFQHKIKSFFARLTKFKNSKRFLQ